MLALGPVVDGKATTTLLIEMGGFYTIKNGADGMLALGSGFDGKKRLKRYSSRLQGLRN